MHFGHWIIERLRWVVEEALVHFRVTMSGASLRADLIIGIMIVVIVIENDRGTCGLGGCSGDVSIEFEGSSTTNEVGEESDDHGDAD